MTDNCELTHPFVEVIVPRSIRSLFTYCVPKHLMSSATPGKRVLVPFGSKRLIGLIVRRIGRTDVKTKAVIDVVDEQPVTPGDLLELALWTAGHYFAGVGDMLPLIAPKEDISVDTIVSLIPEAPEPGGRSPGLIKIYEALLLKGGKRRLELLAKDLEMTGKELAKTLRTPVARKIFAQSQQTKRVKPRGGAKQVEFENAPHNPVVLTKGQQEAFDKIAPDIDSSRFRVHLIHGVTGSGKTEVYAHLARHALELGKSVLLLAPEIALADMLARRLKERLGFEPLVLHSDMAPKERAKRWSEAKDRRGRLVIGARSAVFAPLANPGIIIVDEEHDPTYKQESSPRYNGRDVAIKRGSLINAPVVLGSATPSLESYYHAAKGKYGLIELESRIDGKPLPKVEIVNPEKPGELCDRLKEEIGKRLALKEQTLLFINRRGSARYIQCSACRHLFECRNCSLSLVYHSLTKSLKCHTCAYVEPAPEKCPKCSSTVFHMGGAGSERVEKDIKGFFPQARVMRMDRDTTSKRRGAVTILRAVGKGEVDILIGTQMVTKGHDYPGITLVGAVSADDTLRLPDFRASERTFQLITQAAGRAGRGDVPGLVIAQTASCEHHSIQSAAKHDFKAFYAAEVPLREIVGYPPYVRLAFIRVDASRQFRGEKFLSVITPKLDRIAKEAKEVVSLGPVEAVVFKTKNRFNWRILFKAPTHIALARAIHRFLGEVDKLDSHIKAGVNVIVDMDPMSGM